MRNSLEKSKKLLEDANQCFNDGDKECAISQIEVAVRTALSVLEKESNIEGFGKPFDKRIAQFTNDQQLINIGVVIENLFNPAIYPVGYDNATDDPEFSFEQVLTIFNYANDIIKFVEKKLKEIQ
ncbi:hypothetical protein J7L68_06960 [bacterium]|nr:hypothetical protein [bacterium]